MKTILQLTASTALCLAFAACSSNRAALNPKLTPHGSAQRPLFVGTSTNGDTVVAATYYDAVTGLAVTADHLGLKANEAMTCTREMPTGTHVPGWYCRYDKEMAARREAVQNMLDKPATKTNGQSGPTCTNRAF